MTTGEELVQELESLRQRLNNSRVEATNGLREAMGKDCTFFRMSMSKFINKDYLEIKDMLKKIQKLIATIEGESS